MGKEREYSVLFLEDEPTIREVLTEYMTISGYRVTGADRGDAAIRLVREQDFDLAVLDICVPGADGFQVLKAVRTSGKDTGVIMLTALEDEQTQVKAFNLYADDYVIKPVSPIILLKRMETILRRIGGCGGEQNSDQGLVLREEAYCAYYQGRKLPLTLSEYLLLHTLMSQPNRATCPRIPQSVPAIQMTRDWFRWNRLASRSPATRAMISPTQVRYATISVVRLFISCLSFHNVK